MRLDATRLAFLSDDLKPADLKRYAWTQERGPEAIEENVNWQEEKR
jgi:hypothetical protein